MPHGSLPSESVHVCTVPVLFKYHCSFLTGSLLSEDVPDVTVEVVVAAQQETSRLGEGHGSDATDDVVVGVHPDLLVRPDVKQAACRVVRTSRKGVAIRKVLKCKMGLHVLAFNVWICCINLTKYSWKTEVAHNSTDRKACLDVMW